MLEAVKIRFIEGFIIKDCLKKFKILIPMTEAVEIKYCLKQSKLKISCSS